MNESLLGKYAVVTGGSRGIGQVFARALAAEGARVAVLARQSADLLATAAMLGNHAIAIACDISDPGSVRKAFSQIAETFDHIDIVVCNAGIATLQKIETATDNDIQREFATNLLGPIYCTREAIPQLRKSQGGDILYVSSESVRMPLPYLGPYAASKAGLETFATAMRSELRDEAIRVTILRSGSVEGGGMTAGWNPTLKQEFFAMIEKTGHAAMIGRQAASKASVAEVLLKILTLPRDVNIDLVEVRAR